jgi:hypothetical protein
VSPSPSTSIDPSTVTSQNMFFVELGDAFGREGGDGGIDGNRRR